MSALKVAILWHLHQPTYWDPRISKYRYPWVFLHAARHYHAMGKIAQAHPRTPLAFNFTPVLIEQMEHYVEHGAQDDLLLEAMLRPTDDLDERELELILEHAFKLHLPTMVFPYPRYRELHALLGKHGGSTQPTRPRPQDVRDLQALYLLTWCGSDLRRSESVASLMEKGRGYTEADKQVVFGAMLEAVRETLPLFKSLQDAGHVEITTTPYYHPILPLLIDTESARQSRPDVHLDGIEFRFPADARWHVTEAIRSYRKHFGRDPVGMWPAEGSVSDAALELMAEHGIRWAGTDEGVLGKSIGKFVVPGEEKYRPHGFDRTDLWVYFRDRELSDRIGFVYSRWNPKEGAEDVIKRLLHARNALGDRASQHCYSIMLDGENPWEYYPDRELSFLTQLYTLLADTPGLEPVRFCDHREEGRGAGRLHHVVPGSWIDANFDTWIGGAEKNNAWKILTAARRELARQAPDAAPPREIYGAEGSDWFWWLGPGHDTPYEASYEELFRLNLRRGLEAVKVAPPPILEAAAPTSVSSLFQMPLHLTTPSIDGRSGRYYDWLSCGFHKASEGSFHRVRRHLDVLKFAFDLENLYVRVEGDLASAAFPGGNGSAVTIELRGPESLEVSLSEGELKQRGCSQPRGAPGAKICYDEVLEAMIPFSLLGAKPGDRIELAVTAVDREGTPDRLPQSGFVTFQRPGPDYGQENWSA